MEPRERRRFERSTSANEARARQESMTIETYIDICRTPKTRQACIARQTIKAERTNTSGWPCKSLLIPDRRLRMLEFLVSESERGSGVAEPPL